MKRVSLVILVVLLCSLQGHAQFWINFSWGTPHCQNCEWMERSIRMTPRQAADYHKIVHKYGQKIEKEARRNNRYWDQSAERIYRLRMERDRKLQAVLSPSQFRLYVRFVREEPRRIHDWRGWYNNPHFPNYRPTNVCHRYEDHYWHCDWEYTGNRWHDRFDIGSWHPGKYDRPGNNNGHRHPDNSYSRPDRNDRYDRPNQNSRPNNNGNRNDRYGRDKNKDKRNDKHIDKDKKENKSNRSGRSSSEGRERSPRRNVEKDV